MLTFCLALLGVIFSSYAQPVLNPKVSTVSAIMGSSFVINCTSKKAITWTSSISNTGSLNASGSVSSSGDNVSTLTLNNITENQDGSYTCAESTNDPSVVFTLRVFAVSRVEPEFKYLQNTLLGCNATSPKKSYSYTYTWKKGNTTIEDLKKKTDDKWDFTIHPNGTLELQNPLRTLAGLWTCVASYTENSITESLEIDVNYWAEPYVKPFDKSQNLVQDEKLVLECEVLGHPKPSISWHKGDVLIKSIQVGTQPERYKLESANTYNGESLDNSRLVILNVDFDDGGEYSCMAITPNKFGSFNDTQTVLVRVKDKLAALWPFLGIVAEVVILCTIIFIYEKKRNKDDAVNENAAQDGAAPEKVSEGVRHRGNNPRT